MIYLPRLLHLNVQGYEMYPGTPGSEGLNRNLESGVTMVVGANGLGKTTLVTLLRHMCAGRVRLGNRTGFTFDAGKLRTTSVESEVFADRVGDRARDATAQLVMEIGHTQFAVTRSLRNLQLLTLVIDGAPVEPEEEVFQKAVITAAEVPDFPHWVLLIDYLVFVTEDRAQPFWDRNVQRRLLSVLTAGAADAGLQAEAESAHVSADSRPARSFMIGARLVGTR